MKRNLLTVEQIKQEILNLKGKEVKLSVNRGRKKIFDYNVIVKDVYNSVFTVQDLKDAVEKVMTYSYNDVLCGQVKFNK